MKVTWSPFKTAIIVAAASIIWMFITYTLAILTNYVPTIGQPHALVGIAIWAFLFLFPILLIEVGLERVLDDHPIYIKSTTKQISGTKLACMILLSVALLMWITWIIVTENPSWSLDVPDFPHPTSNATMLTYITLTWMLRIIIWLPIRSGANRSEGNDGLLNSIKPPYVDIPATQ